MTLELEEVRVHQPYTVATVDSALLTYATMGSYRAASKACGVNEDTIRDWHHRFPNRFAVLSAKHSADIEKTIVQAARLNAINAAAGVQEAIDLERQRLATGDVKDAAAAGRNLATIFGITTDKTLLLEGRPTSITENRTGEEALRTLKAAGLIIDTTAEEDPEQTPQSVSPGVSAEQRAAE